MLKSKYPLVTIIILNWNGKELLKTCLSSLYKLTDYPNYKVVVVDNGSMDNSVEFVKKHFPQADILALDKNYGYAKSNNIGIKYALRKYNPEYVLLLNNDTKIIQKDWLRKAIEFMKKNYIDVISVKQISKEFKELYPGAINIFSYGIECKNIDYKHAFLGGWFLLIRTSLVRKINYVLKEVFPSEYFCYMEDSFLFWIIKILGGETRIFDDVSVIHYGGTSGGGKGNPFAIKLCQRNSLFNIYVFYYPSTLIKILPLYIMFTTFNFLYRVFYQRDPKRAKAVINGFLEGLKNLKQIKKYKKIIRKIYKEFGLSDGKILHNSTYRLFSGESKLIKIVNGFSKFYLRVFKIKTLDN